MTNKKSIIRRQAIVLMIVALLFSQTALAQTINSDEKKIAEYIDKHSNDAIAFLEKTVNIESPTEDIAGVKADGMLFMKEFEAIGMKARWIDMPPETKRAGHLIAATNGTNGKRILLLGHLDTVLRGEKFRRDGDRAYGTGIGDMKGGNVILLQALKAMHAAGTLKDARITVLLTGDEEDSCEPVSLCRGDMITAAKESDLALSFEGTVGNTATVGRRGASSWRLEVDAKTGHSSGVFRENVGYGAIFEASRILNEFRTQMAGETYLTFNPSLFIGGTTSDSTNAAGSATGKTNVIPAKVFVDGDLRFISEEQKEKARAKMREIVSKNLPGTSAKIEFFDGIPAMTPREGNYELLKHLDQASRDLGLGPVVAFDPGRRGAGDIAFIADLIPGLDGIGIAGGQKSHAKGESADLSSMATLTKRAAVLIYRLSRLTQ